MTIYFTLPDSRYYLHSDRMVIGDGRAANALLITTLLLVVPRVAMACGYRACKRRLLVINFLRLRKNGIYLAGRMRENDNGRFGVFIPSLHKRCHNVYELVAKYRFLGRLVFSLGAFRGMFRSVSRSIWGVSLDWAVPILLKNKLKQKTVPVKERNEGAFMNNAA